MESRVLILLDDYKFKPEVIAFAGQSVDVKSWHMINDELHGFVDDFAMDVPDRCLLNKLLCQWHTCGLCRGFGRFKEYGEEYKCAACNGFGGNYSLK